MEKIITDIVEMISTYTSSINSVIGILGLILTIIGVVLTIKAISRKRPYYILNEPKSLIKILDNKLTHKIFYGKQEVTNIYSMNFIIWNAGNKYIDAKDISQEKPITLTPIHPQTATEKVEILAVKELTTSRPELHIKPIKMKDEKGFPRIVFNIQGDEALERKDGKAFKILFSHPDPASLGWEVTWRIKGASSGLVKKHILPTSQRPYGILANIACCVIILILSLSPVVTSETMSTPQYIISGLCLAYLPFLLKSHFSSLPWLKDKSLD